MQYGRVSKFSNSFDQTIICCLLILSQFVTYRQATDYAKTSVKKSMEKRNKQLRREFHLNLKQFGGETK